MYCRDSNRRQEHGHIQFNFLGYGFRPREARNRCYGKSFTGFLPAIGTKATKAIMAEVRNWKLHRKSEKELIELQRIFNPKARGLA